MTKQLTRQGRVQGTFPEDQPGGWIGVLAAEAGA